MPRPISHRELIRKLRVLGFVGPFSGGRHPYMEHNGRRIAVPNPHGKDIGSRLLAEIIRELGVSAEQFKNL